MNLNLKGSEKAAVVGVIDPDAYAAAAYSSGWIAAKNFHQFLALVQVGDFVATGTLDAKFQQATDSGGTGVKDVTGTSITQLTQAGTDDNKQVLINLRPEQLDLDNSFTHIRLTVTLGTAGADMGACVFGIGPRSGPAQDSDAATVDEIVN